MSKSIALTPHHPFRSVAAQTEYLTHYDRVAQKWPVESETRFVETSFGKTVVRISGVKDAPPLVLLPGAVLNSLMWIPTIETLSKHYCTYAIDNIYDAGRSIYTRPLTTLTDFMNWLDELCTALGLGNNINLMGLSNGAWLTSQFALHFPKRLAKIVCLAHPTVVNMQFAFIARFMLAFTSTQNFVKFMSWLLADGLQKDEPTRQFVQDLIEDMRLTAQCLQPKSMVTPKILTDQELRNLNTPALFLMGANERTYDPQKALQRLTKIAPQIKTEIIPNAGHDLAFTQAELVTKKVLEFLKT
jgi:pimeloyl-ACP methyl ester carboxylesterase